MKEYSGDRERREGTGQRRQRSSLTQDRPIGRLSHSIRRHDPHDHRQLDRQQTRPSSETSGKGSRGVLWNRVERRRCNTCLLKWPQDDVPRSHPGVDTLGREWHTLPPEPRWGEPPCIEVQSVGRSLTAWEPPWRASPLPEWPRMAWLREPAPPTSRCPRPRSRGRSSEQRDLLRGFHALPSIRGWV